MPNNDVILRFNKVSFEYGRKTILNEADFSIRRGSKITLMGQNGAGKSTIFQMITGGFVPHEGAITIENGLTMATARRLFRATSLDRTVREFFEAAFPKKVYDIEPRIKKILGVVHLNVLAGHDRQKAVRRPAGATAPRAGADPGSRPAAAR